MSKSTFIIPQHHPNNILVQERERPHRSCVTVVKSHNKFLFSDDEGSSSDLSTEEVVELLGDETEEYGVTTEGMPTCRPTMFYVVKMSGLEDVW